MKHHSSAAFAANPESLSLPFAPPRDTWPDWIDAAARILKEEDCGASEQAAALDGIAHALRAEVAA